MMYSFASMGLYGMHFRLGAPVGPYALIYLSRFESTTTIQVVDMTIRPITLSLAQVCERN